MSRLAIGKFKTEPVWHEAEILRAGVVPSALAQWLFDSDSLTKRLRRVSHGKFRVELLGQAWCRPLRCERDVLGMEDRAIALVRQVRLYCNDQPVVYARTVMPKSSLSGRRRRLSRLGGRPLGEMLFRDRSMHRGPMEIAEISADKAFYHCLPSPQTGSENKKIWGRRSVFTLGGKPLLVNEVFIPVMPKASGFRVKQKS